MIEVNEVSTLAVNPALIVDEDGETLDRAEIKRRMDDWDITDDDDRLGDLPKDYYLTYSYFDTDFDGVEAKPDGLAIIAGDGRTAELINEIKTDTE